MNAKSRTIDSTQFSLEKLQQIEVERIQAELIEKKRRHAEELARREAAARAIEQLAIDAQRAAQEQARADIRQREEAREQAEHQARLEAIKAAARDQAAQQELELRRASAQMLEAQAMLRPKRRWWPVLVLALVFGLQGLGFRWYQDQANANRDAITLELSRAEQRAADAENGAKNLSLALSDAKAELDHARATATDPAESTQPPADEAKPEAKKPPVKKPPAKKPPVKKPPPDFTPIDLSQCANTPLGCLERR